MTKVGFSLLMVGLMFGSSSFSSECVTLTYEVIGGGGRLDNPQSPEACISWHLKQVESHKGDSFTKRNGSDTLTIVTHYIETDENGIPKRSDEYKTGLKFSRP